MPQEAGRRRDRCRTSMGRRVGVGLPVGKKRKMQLAFGKGGDFEEERYQKLS